jgi:putative DNA primase/helicase
LHDLITFDECDFEVIEDAAPNKGNGRGKAITEEANFRPTDLWNAQLFVHLHGDKVRYCERLGGWFTYDGKRWVRAMCGEVERLAKDTIRYLYELAAIEPDDKRRQEKAKHATRSEAAGKLAAMLELAKTEEAVIIPPEVFDADPWKFNVQNGTLLIDSIRATVEILPHNPNDLITNISTAEYRGIEAPAPIFEKYVEESAGGDKELMAFRRRLAGYGMVGDMREQVFEYAFGPEAGGKGTETRARADVMGTYARAAEMQTFLSSRSDKVRNDLAALVGARLVTASEPQDGQVFDEGLIRMLTGQDRMSARFLFRENFEFSCGFKIRFEGNHRPHIRSTGGATWRRLLVVPFENTVPEDRRDKTLGDKLKSPEERAGILAWMVTGALEWIIGGLNPPDKVQAAVADYRNAEDRLAPFLDENTIDHRRGQIPAGELYTRYKAWADANGERAMSKRALGMRMEEKGYKPGRTTRGGRAWDGLSLMEREDGD